MENLPLNYLAIIITAIVYMIIGYIWYSPYLFGGFWKEHCCPEKGEKSEKGEMGEMGEKCKKCSPVTIIAGFINALVASFFLSLFIHYTNSISAGEGAAVGFWAWLGFVATTYMAGVIWERRPFNIFFIHAGCMLVSMIIGGLILGSWK
jgi:Protein of unknown function (DUF1761)